MRSLVFQIFWGGRTLNYFREQSAPRSIFAYSEMDASLSQNGPLLFFPIQFKRKETFKWRKENVQSLHRIWFLLSPLGHFYISLGFDFWRGWIIYLGVDVHSLLLAPQQRKKTKPHPCPQWWEGETCSAFAWTSNKMWIFHKRVSTYQEPRVPQIFLSSRVPPAPIAINTKISLLKTGHRCKRKLPAFKTEQLFLPIPVFENMMLRTHSPLLYFFPPFTWCQSYVR